MTVLTEEAPANYVPAAAVIRRVQALIGITGRKACAGGLLDRCEIPGLNLGIALVTGKLECSRGGWNSTCSSEMRRYVEEHRWRRQPPGLTLTLMHESVGSKQD